MHKLLTVLFFLIAQQCFAQGYSYNNDEWWNRMVYEQQPSINNFSDIDTSIVVVSNRYITTDKMRFMSEERGDGQLLYLFVYAHKGQWHVLKRNSLQEAIQLIPDKNRDWVVYTEGMGKIFTSELNRGMMMTSQYKLNVIMLDYPSITTTKGNLGNYLFAIKNARNAYKDHVPVLKQIKEMWTQAKMGSGHISLFFHSMGNYLIRQTVKKKQLYRINDTKWVDNIILNSPCVPQYHHAKWLNKIAFANEIYIQYNPEDRTLFFADLISKKKQLGRRLRKPLSSKAHYINFNNIVDEEHSYFMTLHDHIPAKNITKKYYNTILHGNTIDLSKGFETSTYRGIGVEMLP